MNITYYCRIYQLLLSLSTCARDSPLIKYFSAYLSVPCSEAPRSSYPWVTSTPFDPRPPSCSSTVSLCHHAFPDLRRLASPSVLPVAYSVAGVGAFQQLPARPPNREAPATAPTGLSSRSATAHSPMPDPFRFGLFLPLNSPVLEPSTCRGTVLYPLSSPARPTTSLYNQATTSGDGHNCQCDPTLPLSTPTDS